MSEKKAQTHYKTFHKGLTRRKGKGMTEGDIREKLGCIKVQIHKWPDDVPITVRSLKEILGRCGYYLQERQIRRLSQEGQLEGRKFCHLWFYPKWVLYKWIEYLQDVGCWLLFRRGILKEEGEENDEKELDLFLVSKDKHIEKERKRLSMKKREKERTNV